MRNKASSDNSMTKSFLNIKKNSTKIPSNKENFILGTQTIHSTPGGFFSFEQSLLNISSPPKSRIIKKALIGTVQDSERRTLEAIIESSIEGIYGLDLHGRCTFVNSAALKLFGYSAREVLGVNMHQLIHSKRVNGEKYDQKDCPILKAMRSKKDVRLVEETLWRKDDTPIPVIYSGSAVIDGKKLIGTVVTVIDISERVKVEQQLEEYRTRLELAQKAGKIGIFEWDLVKDSIWWSEDQEAIFGLKKGVLKGKPSDLREVIHPDDYKRVAAEIDQAIKGKKELVSQFKIKSQEGGHKWILARGNIYTDEKGKPFKMVGTNFDITSTKQYEDSLQFLVDASKVLSFGLDYQSTLNKIAELAVERFADWCAVDLLQPNGKIELVAIKSKDPKKLKLAYKLREQYPPRLESDTGIGKVIKSGKTGFYPHIDAQTFQATIKDKKMLKLIMEIGFNGVIIAPLKSEEKVIGTITVVSSESKLNFTHLDLSTVEQLATLASFALENARLYQIVKDERERLESLVANVPGVVWESWGDPGQSSQRIDFVSKDVEDMLGYSTKEWLGVPNFWLEIVHLEDKERAAKEAADIYYSGKGGVSQFRWVKKDGSSLWVEAYSTVIVDSKNTPIGMRGVTMDISERMELERRKDDFISIASHELKTPVTSIKSYTQILLKFYQGQDQPLHYLERMNSQVDRLTELINDLLDVSKIQSGRLELKYEKFEVSEFITDIIEDIQHSTTRHQIIYHPQEQIFVEADRYRIAQVLVNFLSNAIKYSPKAHKVIVKARVKDQKLRVSVQDFGIGINKRNIDKVFDRFYQVANSIRPSFSGLGLGLYISNEIVGRHQGRILAKSVKNQGSTFAFEIPLLKE